MTATSTPRSASVLIIERDDSIRRLIIVALEHAGFRTCNGPEEGTIPVSGDLEHAVIIRDLTLRPSDSTRALEETSAAPELGRRTIVTTTAPALVTKAIGARVFAVLGKPFEIEELVDLVRRCAHSSRTRSERGRRRVQSEPEPPLMKMELLERFVANVPCLRRVLSIPVACQAEAALHAEMRRTIGQLSATLEDAARSEKNRARMTAFRAASRVASELAITAYSFESSIDGSRREH